MTTPDPEQIAAGLTHQIGGTDFSVTFGAHHPWDYLLRYKGEPIAGISSDFFAAVRNIVKEKSDD